MALAIFVWWAAFLAVMYLIYTTHPDGAGDYLAYDKAANAIVQDLPIYTGLDGDKPYLYPPLLAIALAPMVTLSSSYQTHITVWFVVNTACLILGVWLVTRELPSKRLQVGLWVLPPLFAPVFLAYLHGQVTIILFTLIAGAWASARRGNANMAGALLALAAWIKVYPVVILGLFLLRRDWKALRAAIITGIALGILQIVMAGPENMAVFVTRILPEMGTTGQTFGYHANVSLFGFFGRLFLPHPFVDKPLVDSHLLFTASRLIASFMLMLTLVVLILRDRTATGSRFDLQYALVIVSMILLTSSIGVSGLVVLILVYAILFATPARSFEKKRIWMWCLITLLLSPIDALILVGRNAAEPVPMSAWMLSTSFFLLLGLWSLLALRLWKSPIQTVAPENRPIYLSR